MEGPVEVRLRDPEIVYQSKYYTIARAYDITTDHKGNQMEIYAEGIARRSWRDLDNPERGKEIAIGRARKAVIKKLHRERCHHPLMNG